MEEFVLGVSVVTGDEATVYLSGDLDFFALPQLRDGVRKALGSRPRRLVIDLSALSFIDLRGIDGLVEVVREGREGNVPVELRHDSPAVERLAELLHVDVAELLGRIAEG